MKPIDKIYRRSFVFFIVLLFISKVMLLGQIEVDVTPVSCPLSSDGSAVVAIKYRPDPVKIECSDGEVSGNEITKLKAGKHTVTVYDENGCIGYKIFEITVRDPKYSIDIQGTPPVCNRKNGVAQITANFGVPDYSYRVYSENGFFETGITSNKVFTVEGLDEGLYTVEIEDGIACIVIKDFTVKRANGNPIEINYTSKNITCHGFRNGSIKLHLDENDPRYPDYIYEWSNGKNTKDINWLKPGEYHVRVTDGEECWGEETIQILEPEKLRLEIDGAGFYKYCVENHNDPIDVTLSANAYGGIPPYNFPYGNFFRFNSSGMHCKLFLVKDRNKCQTFKGACAIIIPIFCSWDPNEIIGELGYGDKMWLSSQNPVSYTINFENDPELATATAQIVYIKLPLDTNLDMYSLRLDNFGFGDYTFEVPKNTAYYTKRLDLRDSLDIYVDVTAGIDVVNQEVFWRFQSIDPITGLAPQGIDCGFLPVNDSITKKGQGFVKFNIKPRSDIQTGDSIVALANIQFDYNDTIHTNTWKNLLDVDKPTSTIGNIPAVNISDSVFIPVSYSDIGSGVKDIELYMSENGGPFELITILDSTLTGYYFTGLCGKSYRFFSRAIDGVGNAEEMKNLPEVTFALIEQELSLSSEIQQASCYSISDASIDIEVSGGLPPYTYAWSNDSTGQDLTDISAGTYAVQITDETGTSITDTFTIIQPKQLDVGLGDDIELQKGEYITIRAKAGYAYYLWSTGSIADSIRIGGNIDTQTYTYSVTVTDTSGCQNGDTIQVHVFEPTNIIKFSLHTVVKIYPNPTKGNLYLQMLNETNKDIEVKITDITGKLIFEKVYRDKLDNFIEEIDLSSYFKGNYLISIRKGNTVLSQKLILY